MALANGTLSVLDGEGGVAYTRTWWLYELRASIAATNSSRAHLSRPDYKWALYKSGSQGVVRAENGSYGRSRDSNHASVVPLHRHV